MPGLDAALQPTAADICALHRYNMREYILRVVVHSESARTIVGRAGWTLVAIHDTEGPKGLAGLAACEGASEGASEERRPLFTRLSFPSSCSSSASSSFTHKQPRLRTFSPEQAPTHQTSDLLGCLFTSATSASPQTSRSSLDEQLPQLLT
ncbi:uncharacterized protein K452DRAFT_21453 [Aplosporella prunicola CBS 121167]|uniref:Uncharacterized protein n=1 Tax=Aplosporella prunicola CBS 121167 TaxID=1176127 RepID=A0A6A6BEW3_9PEZI|nr:uncharacterized protein K452DRAFT_21453 [Aplosporella prunicola CBS 121167]KAF2142606.1 hypothetical protein K452DRAFT_21453 [Aplosporella prunicola CBS 121167]